MQAVPTMRWLALCLLVVAACSGPDNGALLTVNAPDGPASASRIEIVLADPATVEDVTGQRVAPSNLTAESVRYYKQRAIAGAVTSVDTVNGFSVRIEPDANVVPESDLIPFLIAYDDTDRVVGIGAVLDDAGLPGTVTVSADQLIRYQVDMVSLADTDAANGLSTGEVTTVRCNAFDSGIAWQPTGVQLRLLLPDRGNDPGLTDATARSLDMDCDGVEATDNDCDDLHPEFHAGAVEACDGLDYDCDGRLLEVVACPSNDSTCPNPTGVALCTEANGSTGTCLSDPACRCASGNCSHCVIPFGGVDNGVRGLCEPYLSNTIDVPGCEGDCTVEVIDPPGAAIPWRAKISTNGGPLSSKLTHVTEPITIQLDLPTADSIMAAAGSVVGDILLQITPTSGEPSLLGFAIELTTAGTTCQAQPTPMLCEP